MELWLPNIVRKEIIVKQICNFLQKGRPYQSLIQQHLHSLYPQLHLHQTLYIVHINENQIDIKEPVREEGVLPYPVKQCAICYETDNIVRTTLPCNHSFHIHCINEWFKKSPTCPLCRLDCKNYY